MLFNKCYIFQKEVYYQSITLAKMNRWWNTHALWSHYYANKKLSERPVFWNNNARLTGGSALGDVYVPTSFRAPLMGVFVLVWG